MDQSEMDEQPAESGNHTSRLSQIRGTSRNQSNERGDSRNATTTKQHDELIRRSRWMQEHAKNVTGQSSSSYQKLRSKSPRGPSRSPLSSDRNEDNKASQASVNVNMYGGGIAPLRII